MAWATTIASAAADANATRVIEAGDAVPIWPAWAVEVVAAGFGIGLASEREILLSSLFTLLSSTSQSVLLCTPTTDKRNTL